MATKETHAATAAPTPDTPLRPTHPDVRVGVVRRNSESGVDQFDTVEWEVRDAIIPGKDGPSFEQRAVEFPTTWSQTATNIVAQKYFRGKLGAPERERSVRQMIGRVADTITAWGRKDGYFADAEEADAFHAELVHLLLYQKAAFNSPVWFNVGFEERPQASACFILVDRRLDGLDPRAGSPRRAGSSGAARARASTSRACARPRSSSRRAATRPGPVSFMRGADASAGTIKSGGKTRRAAKMVVLDVDHPDIEEFIWCKSNEEEKARALQAAGYDMSLDSSNWSSIQYQNANNSVRLTDEFMRAVEIDGEWRLTARTTGEVVQHRARSRPDAPDRRCGVELRRSRRAVRHDDQRLAHLPEHGADQRVRTRAASTCHVDNSACNLASINLMKFRHARRRVRRRGVRARGRRGVHSRRRSSSPTPRTRPRRSARTRTRCASSGSATRTSARC